MAGRKECPTKLCFYEELTLPVCSLPCRIVAAGESNGFQRSLYSIHATSDCCLELTSSQRYAIRAVDVSILLPRLGRDRPKLDKDGDLSPISCPASCMNPSHSVVPKGGVLSYVSSCRNKALRS